MKQNVGTLDRAGRAVLSGILLYGALKKEGKASALPAFVAGILASSVLSGYCPLYEVTGQNTVGKPI
ncbi:MAG: YgaP family membrane protein [Actinomycetota bacterium]